MGSQSSRISIFKNGHGSEYGVNDTQTNLLSEELLCNAETWYLNGEETTGTMRAITRWIGSIFRWIVLALLLTHVKVDSTTFSILGFGKFQGDGY